MFTILNAHMSSFLGGVGRLGRPHKNQLIRFLQFPETHWKVQRSGTWYALPVPPEDEDRCRKRGSAMASPTFIPTLMSFARSSNSTSVSQKAFHRKTDSNTSESPIVLGSNWERSRQDIFTLQKRGNSDSSWIDYLSVEAWLRSVSCCGCCTCWYSRGCWSSHGGVEVDEDERCGWGLWIVGGSIDGGVDEGCGWRLCMTRKMSDGCFFIIAEMDGWWIEDIFCCWSSHMVDEWMTRKLIDRHFHPFISLHFE